MNIPAKLIKKIEEKTYDDGSIPIGDMKCGNVGIITQYPTSIKAIGRLVQRDIDSLITIGRQTNSWFQWFLLWGTPYQYRHYNYEDFRVKLLKGRYIIEFHNKTR